MWEWAIPEIQTGCYDESVDLLAEQNESTCIITVGRELTLTLWRLIVSKLEHAEIGCCACWRIHLVDLTVKILQPHVHLVSIAICCKTTTHLLWIEMSRCLSSRWMRASSIFPGPGLSGAWCPSGMIVFSLLDKSHRYSRYFMLNCSSVWQIGYNPGRPSSPSTAHILYSLTRVSSATGRDSYDFLIMVLAIFLWPVRQTT